MGTERGTVHNVQMHFPPLPFHAAKSDQKQRGRNFLVFFPWVSGRRAGATDSEEFSGTVTGTAAPQVMCGAFD